jgi:hypothetical protein
MTIPTSARRAARTGATAFGGQPEVRRHHDQDESNAIDILTCIDRPGPDLSTYSTLGLHLVSNFLDGVDIRIEIAGVAESAASDFPNLVGTAAFYVMKDRWLGAPGVIFPGLLREYGLSTTLEHLVFVTPFPWSELESVELGEGITAHWLLAVPISESERSFLLDRGFDAFEDRMEAQDVEYWRLNRASMV